MTLSDLETAVYTITNRPSLTAETLLAIQAATLKAHRVDFFAKDFQETSLNFGALAYQQSFYYNAVSLNFRAAKYIRVVAVTDDYGNPLSTPIPGQFFKIISPENTLDDYLIDRDMIAYLAGTQWNLKSYEQFEEIIFGYYVNPVVVSGGYYSWIAVEHPYAIIYEAARVVFKMIGFEESVASMKELWNDEIQELRSSQLPLVAE